MVDAQRNQWLFNALRAYDLASNNVRAEALPTGSPHLVWKVEESTKNYVLKVSRSEYSRSSLDFLAESLDRIRAAEIPVPMIHPSMNGERFMAGDGFYSQLQDFIPGSPARLNCIATLKECSKAIQALQAVPVDGQGILSPRTGVDAWIRSLRDEGDKLRFFLKDAGKDLLCGLEDIVGALVEQHYTDFPGVYSHGELQANNLIFDGTGRLRSVLDWDSLQVRPRILDIAVSGFFLCRRNRGGFDLDEGQFREYIDMFPDLEEREKRCIPYVLHLYVLPTPSLIESFIRHSPDKLKWYIPWVHRALASIRDRFWRLQAWN